MNGQAKISLFFKPIGAAGARIANDVARMTMPKAKRFKSDVSEEQVRGENIKSHEKRVMGTHDGEHMGTHDGEHMGTHDGEHMGTHDEGLIDIADHTNGLVVHIGSSWYDALQEEFNKSYFQKLSVFVSTEREKFKVYPPPCEVFTWTQKCSIKKVKVVILGQDPYHGPGQAHGLCFSVPDGIKPPPSLLNMYKELASDIEDFSMPDHGNLTSWAQQGVLLLNACLTVQTHRANSHKDKGWEQFTDSVIKWLNKNLDGVVFLLWGAYAQKKGQCIDKKRHHVLASVHPSPLSAHRGFFGCKHFSQTNAILEQQGKASVDWRL